MPMYSTAAKAGVDINQIFYLDSSALEYPGAPPFPLGENAWGTDGSEWVFVTSTVAVGPGAVCLVSAVPGSWLVAPVGGAAVASAPTGQYLGVQGGSAGTNSVAAPSGTVTASYFWLQRNGNCPNVSCAASTTANALLHTSATVAGQVSAAGGGAGTTYQVNGMVITQAAGSVAGPNTAVLNWPTAGATN